MKPPPIPESHKAIKLMIDNDKRDIKDLWNEALKNYKTISGRELKSQTNVECKNVEDMMRFGVLREDVFQKWRHDGKNLDKLRSLLMTNIRFIESGAQQLLAAATPAFPPAAAIGTAMTFVLNVCKGQSADYDMVTSFFGEMNNFLQRVTILEGRLPGYGAYQTCLMDVFTAFLRMCAFASKFISKGRLKTWFVTSFMGQDAELSSAKNQMDKNLGILESATQFAILANTEGLKGGQQGLQMMQAELQENQRKQYQLEKEQTELMQAIQRSQTDVQDSVDALRTDLQAIIAMTKPKEGVSTTSADENGAQPNNSIRTSISPNGENDARMKKLQDTRLPGTGEWVFKASAWKSWSETKDNGVLLLRGLPGIGKSHLATAVYDHLSKAAKQDPSQYFVVTYFFCDRNLENLNTFYSFVRSTVLQISEQNTVLQNQFAQEFDLKKEAHSMAFYSASGYLQELIVPTFGKDSKYQLCIILDSIDNSDFQADIMSMLESISEFSLKVKMVITCRSVSSENLKTHLRSNPNDSVGTWRIDMSRDDILSDIKLLISNRLQTSGETYGGLAHLSSKAHCKIKDQIEENASTLLYVDLALRYLSGIGREGAILRELKIGLPAETSKLFLKILKSCKRRLPQDLSSPTQLLLVWLTYSFDLLDLDQANQLVQLCSGDENLRVEEEIVYVFNRILRIGPTTKSLDAVRNQSLDGSSENVVSTENSYDDGDLLVSLRDSSMRHYLRDIDITSWDQQDIRIDDGKDPDISSEISSTNHRLIFLYCCRILGVEHGGAKESISGKPAQKLRKYAMRNCLRHWQSIDCNKHEYSENIEVFTAFHNLLSNRHGLAATLEAENMTLDWIIKKSNTMSDEEGYQTFSKAWQTWARLIREYVGVPNNNKCGPAMDMHSETQMYWKGSFDNALQPLFEAHMENWLDGWHENWDPEMARDCALAVLNHTPYRYLSKLQVADEYWKPWIELDMDDVKPDEGEDFGKYIDWNIRTTYLMRSLYRHPLTSTAHFATSFVLNTVGEVVENAMYQELLLAVEKCTDPVQKSEIHIKISKTLNRYDPDEEVITEDEKASRCKNLQQALYHVDSAIGMISDKTSNTRHSALLEKVSLLQSLNEIQYGDSIDSEIIEIFHEIKTYSQRLLINDKSALYVEISYHRGNHGRVMDFFVGLTPTQRLALLVYGAGKWDTFTSADLNGALLPAALLTERTAELLGIYDEMLRDLKLGNCEIIWYDTLARSYKAIGDLQQSSDVLRKAATYIFRNLELYVGSDYYYAPNLVGDYVNLASDVIYQRFRASNQSDVKTMLLQDAEAILFQPLPQSVRLTPTTIIPHLIVLSRMQKRVGTFQKYQESLQQAFDMCWANLRDNSVYNDMENMLHLTKILAIAPSFHREAEITNSAQLYFLGNFSDLERFSNIRRTTDAGETQELEKNLEYSFYGSLEALRMSWVFETRPCTRNQIRHQCKRSSGWRTWEQGPMYVCLCCTASILCQDCYDERIRRNNAPDQAGNEIDFCCDAGEYIKAPMDGWKGVRDGKIYIENEEPIEVDTFLEQVRDKWMRSWDEFWKG